MKRWIGSLALASVAGLAAAQAPFTIVRPADGSRVREKVRVLIPKGSIPSTGYVGFFLGGKFLEATKPPLKGKFFEYVLDTKGRGIADTEPGEPLKLEAVLYVDYNDQPRIIDRSSVDIAVANKSSIPVPSAGIKLRYGFGNGEESVYTIQQRQTISAITEDQNKLGGKAAELPIESETIRMLYAVDNLYGNGDALLRMQPLPIKGKDYADLTMEGESAAKRYFGYEMAPIYMRIRPTGEQVWGSIPLYVGLEGTSGESNRLDLFGSFPLPWLPTKAVRPGDAWQSRFQDGEIDLEKLNDSTSVVRTFPARGEFLGVEWESGHPCAKIKNTIDAAQSSLESRKLVKQGAAFTKDKKVSVEETIWFALDTRKVLKVIRDETLEVKGTNSQFGFGNPFSGGGAGGGAPRGPGGPGGFGGPGGGGGRAGKGGDDVINSGISGDIRQRPGRGGPGGFGGPGGPGGFGGPPPGFGGPSGPGQGGPGFGRGGGPSVEQNSFVRIRIQQIFTLEK
jgi:hypothetical protein